MNTSYGLKNSGVVFISAMSQVEPVGCDRRRFFRRSSKEWYSSLWNKSSVKFWWGNVMVFGNIKSCTGPLVRLHVQINTTVYKDLLKKGVVPNLRSAIKQPAVFMPDNGPCFTVKSIKTFLSEEDFTVIWRPTQNPELNRECLKVTKWKG